MFRAYGTLIFRVSLHRDKSRRYNINRTYGTSLEEGFVRDLNRSAGRQKQPPDGYFKVL